MVRARAQHKPLGKDRCKTLDWRFHEKTNNWGVRGEKKMETFWSTYVIDDIILY